MNKEEEKEEELTVEGMSDRINNTLDDIIKVERQAFAGTSNAALFMVVALFTTIMLWQYPVAGKIALAITLVLLGYVIHKFAETFSNIIRRLTTIASMFAMFSVNYSELVAAGIHRAILPLAPKIEVEEVEEDKEQSQ